jgi:hypothetical protein
VRLNGDGTARPGPSGSRELAAVIRAAAAFPALRLDELGAAELKSRVDRKFLAPVAALPAILLSVGGDYRALAVGGRRFRRYRTTYLDTPDLQLYRAHHAGRRPRCKIRIRTYLDTGVRFLELKLKTNKGRTLKRRIRLEGEWAPALAALTAELTPELRRLVPLARLRTAAAVEYRRLTLVSRHAAERVTMDFVLRVVASRAVRAFPSLAIVEIKQDRQAVSPVLRALHALHVREGGLSKYCLAIAALVPEARSNRFRRALRHLERVAAAGQLPNTGRHHGFSG